MSSASENNCPSKAPEVIPGGLAGARKQKRKRRSFSELERNIVCPHESCKRKYASSHALHQHLRIKHNGIIAADKPPKFNKASNKTASDSVIENSPDTDNSYESGSKSVSAFGSPSSIANFLAEESNSSTSSTGEKKARKRGNKGSSGGSSPSKKNNTYHRTKSEGSAFVKDAGVDGGKKRRKRSKSLNCDIGGFNLENLIPDSLADLELSDIYEAADNKLKLPYSSLFSFRNTSTPTLTCIPSKIWGTESSKLNFPEKETKSAVEASGNESSLSTALDFFDENFTLQISRSLGITNNSGSTNDKYNIFNTCSTPSSYTKSFELDEYSLLQSIVKDNLNLKGMA